MLEVVKYAVNNSKLAASKKFTESWYKPQENDLLAISSSRRRLPGLGMKVKYRGIHKQLYRWLLEV